MCIAERTWISCSFCFLHFNNSAHPGSQFCPNKNKQKTSGVYPCLSRLRANFFKIFGSFRACERSSLINVVQFFSAISSVIRVVLVLFVWYWELMRYAHIFAYRCGWDYVNDLEGFKIEFKSQISWKKFVAGAVFIRFGCTKLCWNRKRIFRFWITNSCSIVERCFWHAVPYFETRNSCFRTYFCWGTKEQNVDPLVCVSQNTRRSTSNIGKNK